MSVIAYEDLPFISPDERVEFLKQIFADPPNGEAERVFYMFKLVGSFYGRWFTVSEMLDLTPLPKNTIYRYMKLFLEQDVTEYQVVHLGKMNTPCKMYRAKRKEGRHPLCS